MIKDFVESCLNKRLTQAELLSSYENFLGLKEHLPSIPAGSLFRAFPDVTGADNYTLTLNNDEVIPKEGDILFWEDHLGIFISGDIMSLKSLEIEKGQVVIQEYAYEMILGWLSPLA